VFGKCVDRVQQGTTAYNRDEKRVSKGHEERITDVKKVKVKRTA
jgi:hypothetical protein